MEDRVGVNAGLYSLASGQEVLSHYDQAMHQRFLPSGRVQFLPLSEVNEDGVITSLVTGRTRRVRARKTVDGTYSAMAIPATHARGFQVADGVTCVPPNDLPRVARDHRKYVIVGAGKTGMDTCTWLLEHEVPPQDIRWIMPRDAWILNRSRYQPGPEFLAEALSSIANQVQVVAESDSVAAVFLGLEAAGEVMRIDLAVEPTLIHGAIVSRLELEQLRRVTDIVRMGRVQRIDRDEVILERGAIPVAPDSLYVDCSAVGIPPREPRPIFAGERITLQWVRRLQPSLSAALLGHVEATIEDDDEKNRLCQPVPPPNYPRDWLAAMQVDLANQYACSRDPRVAEWESASRLSLVASGLRSLSPEAVEAAGHLQRYRQFVRPAVENLARLLA